MSEGAGGCFPPAFTANVLPFLGVMPSLSPRPSSNERPSALLIIKSMNEVNFYSFFGAGAKIVSSSPVKRRGYGGGRSHGELTGGENFKRPFASVGAMNPRKSAANFLFEPPIFSSVHFTRCFKGTSLLLFFVQKKVRCLRRSSFSGDFCVCGLLAFGLRRRVALFLNSELKSFV